MVRHRKPLALLAASLLLSSISTTQAEQGKQGQRFAVPHHRFSLDVGCEITAIVTFTRDGNIFGRPKITYESENATDDDRLLYRIAVMEALQRCTPMPFTEGMGGAVAGRPFAVRFQVRKPPPKPIEKRAWLTTTIL